MKHDVLDADGVRICEVKCDTCIFRPHGDWDPRLAPQMSEEAIKKDGYIPCHETYLHDEKKQAICRGFFDVYKSDTLMTRMAVALGFVKIVSADEIKANTAEAERLLAERLARPRSRRTRKP